MGESQKNVPAVRPKLPALQKDYLRNLA